MKGLSFCQLPATVSTTRATTRHSSGTELSLAPPPPLSLTRAGVHNTRKHRTIPVMVNDACLRSLRKPSQVVFSGHGVSGVLVGLRACRACTRAPYAPPTCHDHSLGPPCCPVRHPPWSHRSAARPHAARNLQRRHFSQGCEIPSRLRPNHHSAIRVQHRLCKFAG